VSVGAAAQAGSLVGHIAGGPPQAVALAYRRAAEHLPASVLNGTKRGRRDLLAWQAAFSPTISRTDLAVFYVILQHYNYERGDAWPGYERIAELAKCSRAAVLKSVAVLECQGFLTVERRFRLVDRWPGRHRHDRTNVYRFADGALGGPRATDDGDGASEVQLAKEREAQRLAALASAEAEGAPAEGASSVAPSPTSRPTAPASRPRGASSAPPAASGDPYWDVFVAAFTGEHHAAYGSTSDPGTCKKETLRSQVSEVLLDLAAECVAWGAQREPRLEMDHLEVAEDLARRMSRAWLKLPGTNNRHRDRKHPIGWMIGDLAKLCAEAVEGWKRVQRRLAPVPAPAFRPLVATWRPTEAPVAPHRVATQDARIREAECVAVRQAVMSGVDFSEALRLAEVEGARLRSTLAALAPAPVVLPTAAELPEQPVAPADRPPPE